MAEKKKKAQPIKALDEASKKMREGMGVLMSQKELAKLLGTDKRKKKNNGK